jgi:ATP-dependent Clp protease protease subunit
MSQPPMPSPWQPSPWQPSPSPEPSPPPEIPYPYPPMREPPRRTDPLNVPLVEMPATSPSDRLFQRRTVLVSGALDHEAVSTLCAQLMSLDGRSADDVELVVSSDGGPVDAIGAVLDVLDLMRARVNAMCTGRARGTAAVLVACATGTRRAGRHATFSLRLPGDTIDGGGADLTGRLEERALVRRTLVASVARATGQPAEVVEAELDHGGVIDADAAVAFGLVDTVVAPPAS